MSTRSSLSKALAKCEPLTGEEIVEYANYLVRKHQLWDDEDFKQFCCEQILIAQKSYDPSRSAIGTFLIYRAEHFKTTYFRITKPQGQYTGLRPIDSKGNAKPKYRTSSYSTIESGSVSGNENTRMDGEQVDLQEQLGTEDDVTPVEVVEFLKDLPQRTREIVWHYAFNGLSFREIGELHGITESRVCQILHSLRNGNFKSSLSLPTDIVEEKSPKSFSSVPRQSRPINEISFEKLIRAA